MLGADELKREGECGVESLRGGVKPGHVRPCLVPVQGVDGERESLCVLVCCGVACGHTCPDFYYPCPKIVTSECPRFVGPCLEIDSLRCVFGDLSGEEITAQQDRIAAAALASARRVASICLADGPGLGLEPDRITEVLIRRDAADPVFERLAPFEERWALLVIRLLRAVLDPASAVADAHARGASWADIGGALGIARQTAHNRFSGKV